MPYLFLTTAIIALVVFAPLKFTVSLFFCIGLVTLVVKLAASQIIGPVSLGAAARSVAWACLLPGLVILGLLWTLHGQLQVEGLAAILLLSVLFASFVLGFKYSLGASFGSSAGIAVISTVVSIGLLFALKPLLF